MELRLAGISDIAPANELLSGGFDRDLNDRFACQPAETADYHRLPTDYDLPSIFCIQEQRTLSVNRTLSFENRIYQIDSESANYSPSTRKVQVRRYLDGGLHMFYRGRETAFQEIDPALRNRQTKKSAATRSSSRTATAPRPKTNHPWNTPWSLNQLSNLHNQKQDISNEF